MPRALPTPGGALSLEYEPSVGDVYYAVVDLVVDEAGEYLLWWASESDLRLWIGDRKVLRRRGVYGRAPREGFLSLRLPAGRHRVVARIIRGATDGGLYLRLLDANGRPAPVRWSVEGLDQPPPPPAPSREGETPPPPVAAGTPVRGTLAWVEAALHTDPTDGLAAWIGALLQKDRDRDHARFLLDQALDSGAKFALAWWTESEFSGGDPALPPQHRVNRRLQALEKVLALDPEHLLARLVLAAVATRQGRYEEAEAHLAEAASQAPHAVAVLQARADLARAQDLSVVARRYLEEAAAAHPEACTVWDSLLSARRQDEDLRGSDEAAKQLEACGRQGRLAYAEHLAERGRLAEATEALRPLLEVDPASLRYGLRIADLLGRQDRAAEAIEILRPLASFWPRNPTLAVRLAQLHADAGRDAEARTWRHRALALDPGDFALRRALAFKEGVPLHDHGALDLEKEIEQAQTLDPAPEGTDAVLLIDHATVDVRADDPHRPVILERVQTVTRVLTKDGVDQEGEVHLPEEAEVVALYVRKPDGRRLEPELLGGKESISLVGLEIGDDVVTDYIVSRGPRTLGLPGWATSPFYVRVFGMPLVRSSYVARAPKALGLEVEAHNLKVRPPTEEAGSLVFRHRVAHAAPLFREKNSVDADEFLPWFRVGAGVGPEGYAAVWGDYLVGRAWPSPAVHAFAQAALREFGEAPPAGADALAKVRAVARAVDGVVRGDAPSNRFGDRAEHILERGRGSRLLLTRAALSALGIPSRIALVRPFQADPNPRRFPAGDLYTYAMLRVDLPDGSHLWLDQNVRTAPIGKLRRIVAGQPALLLAEPGVPGERVTVPRDPVSQDEKQVRVVFDVARDGRVQGTGEERYTGFAAALLRTGIEQVPADRRRQVVETGLARAFGPITLTALDFDGGSNEAAPGEPFAFRYRFDARAWARPGEGVLEIPGGTLFPAQLSKELITGSERTTPLLLAEESAQRLEARFHLPEGMHLLEPEPEVNLETEFGTFHRRVRTEGAEVVVEEFLRLNLVRVPPERYGALARFCGAVDAAQGRALRFAVPAPKDKAGSVSRGTVSVRRGVTARAPTAWLAGAMGLSR